MVSSLISILLDWSSGYKSEATGNDEFRVPIWPPVASKCLLLYIRNDQSNYIEISDPIGDVGYLSVWVIQQLFSKNLHFCACAGNNVTTVVTKNK